MTAEIGSVTLAALPASQRPVLEHLMQLCLHDFSEFAAIGAPHGEVGRTGGLPMPGWTHTGRSTGAFRC
ncbi:MAG: hypothetical protein WDN49_22255 [Acetobacteraceae bacterium]